tara:strand:- start:333 stop:557 length:225 start_codon:yes stop_codon:yes gene_type:complete
MRNRFFITVLVIFIIPNYAFAYLDPGSGSIILQILGTLIAAIAGVYLSIKLKIKEIIVKAKNFFSKKNTDGFKK